jgi:hypothetical protein
MNKTQFPELWDFFHAYFNEDFYIEFENQSQAIDRFLKYSNIERIRKLMKEIELLLSSRPSHNEWENIIYGELGCAITLVEKTADIEQWLRYLYARLAKI